MRLGLLYGFSHSHESLDLILEAERLGLRLGLDRRGLRLRRHHAAGLDRRADQKNPPRHRQSCRCPARTPAMTAMTAMTLDATFGRTLHPRRRTVGAAGGRRMARGAVRQAAGALPRVHRRSCKRSSRAKRRSSSTATNSRSRTAARARPASASRCKSILHGRDATWRSTCASITPRACALAAEIADGVLPIWMNPEQYGRLQASRRRRLRQSRRRDKTPRQFDVAPFVTCVMGPDVEKCRSR